MPLPERVQRNCILVYGGTSNLKCATHVYYNSLHFLGSYFFSSSLLKLYDMQVPISLVVLLRKAPLTLLLVIFFCTQLHAQELSRPAAYSDKKGLTLSLLVQPTRQSQTVFDTQLQSLGFPSQTPFGLLLGIGATYLFKTGTAVGYEFAYFSNNRERNGNRTQIQPHLYSINVKQYVSDWQKARLFVGTAVVIIDEHYTFSQQTAAPATLAQAITDRNAAQLKRHTGALGVSMGITFKGYNAPTERLTDFVEMEAGYRFHVEKPYYTAQNFEINGLSGDRFRQFYISFRAGVFVRGR